MKINSITKQNNFCGIPILRAQLQQQISQKSTVPVNAIISFMEASDLEKAGMQHHIWSQTKYGANILLEFEEKLRNRFKNLTQRFLFTEITPNGGTRPIKSLASVFIDDDQIRLAELQSIRPEEYIEPTKGAGLIILYTLSKMAEVLKRPKIFLNSRLNGNTLDFYKNAGMRNLETTKFILENKDFSQFQQRIESHFPVTEFFVNNIK